MKKVYNSHGCMMTFADLREIEVTERGNYPSDELDAWQKKYKLDEHSPVIWVTPNKNMAVSYGANLDDRDEILEMSDDELIIYIMNNDLPELYEYTPIYHTIILESNDGDEGFVMTF